MSEEMAVSTARPRVAVILVNWNAWRDVIECLDSLLAQRYENIKVFVVDNKSADASVHSISAWCKAPSPPSSTSDIPGVRRLTMAPPFATKVPVCVLGDDAMPVADAASVAQVTIVGSKVNRGFAGGNNLGVRIAGVENFKYFWFLNTDTVVDAEALAELVARIESDERIGIVGSTLMYYDTPSVVQALGGGTLDPNTTSVRHIGGGASVDAVPIDPEVVERRMAYVVGASMLVRDRFILDVGLMAEDYFLYFEEIDWAMRARGRYRLGYAPRSRVYHKVGRSSAAVPSVGALSYLYRSRIRFVSRFMRNRLWATIRHLMLELARHIARGRLRQAKVIAAALRDAPRIVREVGKHPQP